MGFTKLKMGFTTTEDGGLLTEDGGLLKMEVFTRWRFHKRVEVMCMVGDANLTWPTSCQCISDSYCGYPVGGYWKCQSQGFDQ
jgi:hypothetical protein